MSTTIFHPGMPDRSRRGDGSRRLGRALDQIEIMGRAADRVIEIAAEAQGAAMRQAFRAMGFPSLPRASFDKARACGTPSHACPSPFLGEIRKVVDRREHVHLAFRVRNVTRCRRLFTLSVGPHSPQGGATGGSVTLSPASVDLDPGEIAIVRADVDASQYEAGVAYRRIVTIASRNCEPMRLAICVEVEREEDCAPLVDLHCCCEPRMRPLRWYHHYYCDPAEGAVAAPAEYSGSVRADMKGGA